MKLIFVTGLPGCGKSYFARHLSRQIKSDYINSELIRKDLFYDPGYPKNERGVLFRKLLEMIRHAFQYGQDIVVDTILYNQRDYRFFEQNLSDYLIQTVIFEIISSEDIIEKRLMEDRPDSDTNLALYQLIRSYVKPLSTPCCKIWSGPANIQEMLDKAISYLNNK